MSLPDDPTKDSSHRHPAESPSQPGTGVISIGAESSPGNFRRKRATDLILPPEEGRSAHEQLLPQEERLALLHQCLRDGISGCFRISNDRTELRGALLLHRGRIVGAIYTSKLMPEAQPSDGSLRLFMSELGSQATKVQAYEIPEERVLCMAALFTGQPVPRSDELAPLSYFDYITSLLVQQKAVACIAVNVAEKTATYLALVYKGKYLGSFHVDEPVFTTDISLIRNVLSTGVKAVVHACVLPMEKLQQGDIGFTL